MSARDSLPIALLFTRRKLLSAKANLFFLGGFVGLLAFIWIKGAFIFSFRVFLFVFPHLFLVLSQDMFRDEVDSGALENPLFIGGGYRSYLGWKNGIIGAAAMGTGLAVFAVFLISGFFVRQLAAVFALQFAAGTLAGLYYQSLAGFLSFFLRAGSNVLVIILGQALGIFCLFLSGAQRPEWLKGLVSNSFSGWAARMEMLAVAAVFPNIIVVRGAWWSVLAVGLLAGVFFGLQRMKIRALELRR